MIRACLAALRAHRGVFVALLSAPIALAVAWWATEPRPRAHWVETGDRYDEFDFTPDGRSILTRSDGNLILRDATTGRKSLSLLQKSEGGWEPMSEMLRSRSITPDGRTLIGEVSRERGNDLLKLWDLETGSERIALGPIHKDSLDESAGMEYRMNYANHVRSADGSTVALSHHLPTGTIAGEVWDVKAGRRLAAFDHCLPIALSPDGRILVACDSRDGRIPPKSPPMVRLREVATGVEILSFESARKIPLCTAAFSSGGTLLTVATHDNLTVRNLALKGEIFAASGSSRGVLGEDEPPWFSPDGTLLFPAGNPRFRYNKRCLDLSVSPPRWVKIAAEQPPSSLDFAPDAKSAIAFGDFLEGVKAARSSIMSGSVSESMRHLEWIDYPSGRVEGTLEIPRA